MKSSTSLVAYSSSDEESSDKERLRASEIKHVSKKRKLPSLASSLVVPAPIDDPSRHKGRIRAKPHVDGQYAAHVYISLTLPRNSSIFKLLEVVLSDGKEMAPTLCELWHNQAGENEHLQRPELHISLSRPIYLWAHQREHLKKTVKGLCREQTSFPISFSGFSELINDEKSRAFLTMEVGAGHPELHMLSEALTPALKAIRQQEFYADPRFHASIAWALLDQPSDPKSFLGADKISSDDHDVRISQSTSSNHTEFPTIPHLPVELVSSLNTRYGPILSSPRVARLDAEGITIKIGKDTSFWRFVGDLKQ